MISPESIIKRTFDYRTEFRPDELDQVRACTEAHGFAIVKGLLPDIIVEMLQREVQRVVDPEGTLGPGDSRTHLSFIETAYDAWALFEHQPFMNLHRALIGTDELCVHRSAAIIRKTGSKVVNWHSDWAGYCQGPPKNTGDVLNRGLWPSGKWFYITGSRPTHGGLCVIEDSHRENWQGPEGFKLTSDRRSFYKDDGGDEGRYDDFDIPGLVPLITDPGDCLVFAHRTQHGAFSNQEEEDRLSCAVGFRDRSHHIETPWELPESARTFAAELPDHLNSYADGYVGIDPGWKAD